MWSFVKGLLESVELTGQMRRIAWVYAGRPDRMREEMLKVVRRDLVAPALAQRSATAERLDQSLAA